NPIAHIKMEQDVVSELYPDGTKRNYDLQAGNKVADIISRFIGLFKMEEGSEKFQSFHFSKGLFGYTTYDAVRYFEDIKINTHHAEDKAIPDLCYSFYQYVIVINHF